MALIYDAWKDFNRGVCVCTMSMHPNEILFFGTCEWNFSIAGARNFIFYGIPWPLLLRAVWYEIKNGRKNLIN